MKYAEVIHYLYESFPCFQQVGKTAYVPSLDNINDLLSYLGNPERLFRCVHVAGTNGKGSTSHYTASILQEAGYKVGLYTSPHLVDFTERIRVNGVNIPKKSVCSFVKKHATKLSSMRASLFEVTTAMAFDYFSRENVDVAVIEVGLGGRLDSTNVIRPVLSVITNIGFDHMQILGDSLPLIAREKAGIIKHNTPVVIGEKQEETAPVFDAEAKEHGSRIIYAQEQFSLVESVDFNVNGSFSVKKRESTYISNATSGLKGVYQQKNIITVCAVIEELRHCKFSITKTAIKNGFKNVVLNTNFYGRWQTVSKNPLVICDTGHNYDGLRYSMAQLKSLKKKDIRIVWGMVGDKDIASIITLLPDDATYYISKPQNKRAMSRAVIEPYFAEKQYTYYSTIQQAYNSAKKRLSTDSVIYVGGSSYVVAEFLSKKKF